MLSGQYLEARRPQEAFAAGQIQHDMGSGGAIWAALFVSILPPYPPPPPPHTETPCRKRVLIRYPEAFPGVFASAGRRCMQRFSPDRDSPGAEKINHLPVRYPC